MNINLQGQSITLLHEKALWMDHTSALLIADLHLGKLMHFRKSGIAVSARAQLEDYENLDRLIRKTNPKTIYFLGDLFHSSYNNDWLHFEKLIKNYSSIQFILIKGNHDIIEPKLFLALNIRIVNDYMEDEHFIYSHQPVTFTHSKINIAGHVHPGVTLNGIARQLIKIPCFYFHKNTLLLPAFGQHTGLFMLPKLDDTTIYTVLPNEVKKLNFKEKN